MDSRTLQDIIYRLRRHRTELDNVEAKAARNNNPNELWKTFSAFANQSEGGLIICGLDEDSGFETIDIYDTRRLQEHIAAIASQMEPALCPETTVMDFEGKTIIAIEIPVILLAQRPCYYKPKGLYEGSYIRVSTSNRRMTNYEISVCLSNRSQPNFDAEPIHNATLEDLDSDRINGYLELLKRIRPAASYLNLPYIELLEQLKIAIKDGRIMRPSLAALLVFGKYPHLVEPQLVITYLQYYDTTETELTPRGERFLDNRKFEGPIREMADEAVHYILANIHKASLIRGVVRQDIPEYPEVAIREAIINAIAHRDYSPSAQGTFIQIRLFLNRLEIESPGGLYGNVALENLKDGQSTRNRILMRFLEDLNIVENRGSGVDAILGAMQVANLQPPQFEDKISHFKITLYNTPLQSDEDRILVYIRQHGSIKRAECQMLLNITPRRAKYILQEMKNSGILKQEGTLKGTYYVELSTSGIAPKRKHITVFKVGKLWLFKHFFADKELFKALLDYYNQDLYRFEFTSIGVRNTALKLLERNGFDYDLVEDLAGYVVKLSKFDKYAQILKNSVVFKEAADEKIFLMKDQAAVTEAVSLGAQIVEGEIVF